MNSDEIWLLQLWSGTIGTFFAAILGGLVALLVVRLTNTQQRKTAAEAREIQALAEFISEVQFLTMSPFRGDMPIADRLVRLNTPVVKLHMAGPNVEALAKALEDWPDMLVTLRGYELIARTEQIAVAVEIEKVIQSAWLEAMSRLPHWFRYSPESQAETVGILEKHLKALKEAVAQVDSVLLEHGVFPTKAS